MVSFLSTQRDLTQPFLQPRRRSTQVYLLVSTHHTGGGHITVASRLQPRRAGQGGSESPNPNPAARVRSGGHAPAMFVTVRVSTKGDWLWPPHAAQSSKSHYSAVACKAGLDGVIHACSVSVVAVSQTVACLPTTFAARSTSAAPSTRSGWQSRSRCQCARPLNGTCRWCGGTVAMCAVVAARWALTELTTDHSLTP